MSDSESIPMKSAEPGSKGKKAFVVSTAHAIAILILVVFVVILVGVLSGVLSARQAAKKAREEAFTEMDLRNADSSTKGSPTDVAPTEPTGPEPWYKVRLPDNVKPIHYEVYLRPYLSLNTFEGKVDILIEVTNTDKYANYILIHINEMDIRKSSVAKQMEGSEPNAATPGDEVKVKKRFQYKKNHYYIFEMEENLEVGKYVIHMEYNASLSLQLNGFYNSTYTNSKGEKRRLATTKFQPTDTRKALPCFDEPALKATFKTRMAYQDGYQALSNMPVEQTTDLDGSKGWHIAEFEITVPMSTYLLAFIVCDFKYTNGTTGMHNNVTMKVWTTPDQVNQTEFALKDGRKMLTFFENYYKVPYPLPKADMIAIPDFSSGAMENWGLMTYRETALLIEEGVSAASNRQRVSVVVSHELAHMWFGNLVSPKWWNDLWLNEGFASFVEYLGVHEAHPDWRIMEVFLLSDLQLVFPLDSLVSSHPISVEVDHPKKIKQIFDRISYSKGASIIRMLSGFMGHQAFVAGLSSYLIKYKYGSAESKDLWNSLSEKTNLSVPEIMDTWTLQMGFPVVKITRKGNTARATAVQKHFLLDPNAKVTTPSPYDYTWYVPLTYVFQDDEKSPKTSWMNRTSVEFEWPTGQWIKGNYKQEGYYRVNYDDANWEDLVKQLRNNPYVFTSEDRSSLIDDAFNLARAGQLDYGIALSTLDYLNKEDMYVPWKTALNRLSYLETVLDNRPAYGMLQKYKRKKVKELAEELGWNPGNNASHLSIYLRGAILGAACAAGDKDAIKNASDIFQDWKAGKIPSVNVDLRSLVYRYGIANSGPDDWEWLFNKYMNTSEAGEKVKLMYALAGSTEPWILSRFLSYSLDDSKVRSQDAVYLIVYVARNPAGKYLAWNFVRANWDALFEMYSTSTFRLTSLVSGVTSFNTEFDLQQMKTFFDQSEAGTSENARKQALERTQANVDWLKNYEETIEKWLQQNAY